MWFGRVERERRNRRRIEWNWMFNIKIEGARPRAEPRQAWLEVVKSDIEWVGPITSSLDLDAPRK